MEKLQAAIERARERRAAEGVSDTPAAPRKRLSTTAATADWSELREVRIDPRMARRNRLFVDAKSHGAVHFDRLRTKVLQQCRDGGWRRLLVTSATAGCGKTTVCCNLAVSFARQRDRRIVLLDFDMRRPAVAKTCGISLDQGFAEVMDGTVAFSDIAVRLGETVAIAANAKPHDNPAQLILQDRTTEIVAEIEERYQPDLMVFDTPPMLSADDTMALLKQVDCALIVAAAEATTTDEVDRVETEIAQQTNVMGVVLNKTVHVAGADKYYYD